MGAVSPRRTQRSIVKLVGDIVNNGAAAVAEQDAARLANLLRDFLS